MKSNPMVDFAVFPTWVFRAIPGDTRLFWNQFTTENDLDRFLRSDMPWHTSGPIWKKTSLRQKGPWDDRALSAQDWEFHIRAIAAGLSYIKVPEPDSFWRLSGAGSISSSLGEPTACVQSGPTLQTSDRASSLRGCINRAAAADPRGGVLCSCVPHWTRPPPGIENLAPGRQTRVVGLLRFVAVLGSEFACWMAQRVNRSFVRFLFPELRMIRTHLAATTPTHAQISATDGS